MRARFRQYYTPSEADFDALLAAAIIVLDTNVLFNLYRTSEKTADELFTILDSAKAQLWMPYQVGFEYHENIEGVLVGLRSKHENFDDVLRDGLNKLRGVFGDFRHPFIKDTVLAAIDNVEKQLIDEFKKEQWTLERLEERANAVRLRIEGLFDDGRIGTDFGRDILLELFKEGAARYKDDIPPGFKDTRKNKSARRPYGDLIIWKEMIAQAKAQSKPVVFVTDDAKEDWWLRVDGKNMGPLPSLRAEMSSETAQDFCLYTSEQFLTYAAPLFLKRAANAKALEEVERSRRARQFLDAEELRTAAASFSDEIAHIAGASYTEQARQRVILDALNSQAEVGALLNARSEVERLAGEANLAPWLSNNTAIEKFIASSNAGAAAAQSALAKIMGDATLAPWLSNKSAIEKIIGDMRLAPELMRNTALKSSLAPPKKGPQAERKGSTKATPKANKDNTPPDEKK